MKNFFVAFVILFALGASAQTPNAPAGKVQSISIPDNLQPAATINGLCATPATGCATGQWTTIKLNGRSTVGAQIVPATFTGTLKPYISQDNGATWVQVRLRQSPGSLSNNSGSATQAAYAGSTTTENWIILFSGPATDVAVISTAAVTNTATVQLLASNAVPQTFVDIATTRGVQPPAAIGVQEFKDAGRSYVVFSADGVTPAIAETVITFTKTVADTQTATQTSYTITNAKTFRLQAICASMTAGAAANRVRVAFRMNTGGACIAGSNILFPVVELAPNYGTATAAEGGANGCVQIPDGFEIAGNGTKAICLTEAATAASGTLSVNLIGFEY